MFQFYISVSLIIYCFYLIKNEFWATDTVAMLDKPTTKTEGLNHTKQWTKSYLHTKRDRTTREKTERR